MQVKSVPIEAQSLEFNESQDRMQQRWIELENRAQHARGTLQGHTSLSSLAVTAPDEGIYRRKRWYIIFKGLVTVSKALGS